MLQRLETKSNQYCDEKSQKSYGKNDQYPMRTRLALWNRGLVELLHEEGIPCLIDFCRLVLLCQKLEQCLMVLYIAIFPDILQARGGHVFDRNVGDGSFSLTTLQPI